MDDIVKGHKKIEIIAVRLITINWLTSYDVSFVIFV